MNELSIGFSGFTNRQVADLGLVVYTALTTPPGSGFFTTLTTPPSALKETYDLLDAALSLETTSTSAALRKSHRNELVRLLTLVAAEVELIAQGDLVKLTASGFSLRKKPGGIIPGPLPPPINVRLFFTGVSCQILMKCKAVPGALNYHGQYSLSPTGPFTDIDAFSNSQKILFEGLPRGQDVYFRVRANGASGPGGWSSIVSIMVI